MAFFFTCLFMFFVFWRPQDWLVPALYGWPMLDMVFFLAVLAFLGDLKSGRARVASGHHVGLLVGLWVSAMASHIPYRYFVGMLNSMVDVGRLCFFALLLLCVLDRMSRLRNMALLITAMAALMAVHVLLQQRLGYGFGGQMPLLIPGPEGDMYVRTKFFGIFADPNDTAQMLGAAIPLLLAVPKRMSFWKFLIVVPVAVLLVLGVLSTRSRGGLIGLAAIPLGLLLLSIPPRLASMFLVAGALAGLSVMFVLGPRLLDVSAHDRVVMWGVANYAFARSPLFGIGQGMWLEFVGRRSSHNAFVSCYTETGLLGYWFWFGLLVLCWRGQLRVRSFLRHEKGVEAAFLRRFSGVATVSLFSFCTSAYFLTRAWIYPMYFLIGLVSAGYLVAWRRFPDAGRFRFNTGRDILGFNTVATLGSMIYVYVSILILNAVVG